MLDIFIVKSNIVHNCKYDYSLVIYKNNYTKVDIICSEHGVFSQTPKNHLNNHGCSKCSYEKKKASLKKGIDEFIRKSNLIHNNKYYYNNTIYINNKTDVIVTCFTHGDFKVTPTHHYNGHGCKKCSSTHRRTPTDLIDEFNIIHNFFYKYEYDKNTSLKNKIYIICPLHGQFHQQIQHHLKGSGCPNCSSSKGEKYIKNWLEGNKIEYIPQMKFKGCLSLKNRNLIFDFFYYKFKFMYRI